jgi:5-methylcytosine-specific restriction protein A
MERCPARHWDLDDRVLVRLAAHPHLSACGCGRAHDHLEEALNCAVRPVLKALRDAPPPPEQNGTDTEPFPMSLPREFRQRMWPHMRSIALSRDGRRCCACGKDLKAMPSWYTEVHHIRARRNGGSDHPGNLITLCVECHGRLTDEMMRSMRVEEAQAPSGPF